MYRSLQITHLIISKDKKCRILINMKYVTMESPYLELFQLEQCKKKYITLHMGAAREVSQLLGKYLA